MTPYDYDDEPVRYNGCGPAVLLGVLVWGLVVVYLWRAYW